jgi:hypothetical protein
LMAGCGSGGSDTNSSSEAVAESTPAPPKSDFPSPEGRSLEEVLEVAGPSQLKVLPAASVFYKGENRFPFGVFDKEQNQVTDAQVALYFSRVPEVNRHAKKAGAKGAEARAKLRAREEPAIGPFPASIESLETEPAYRAKTTVDDPDAGKVVYKTELKFPSNGKWQLAAMIKKGNELTTTLLPPAIVGEFHRVPRPGQKAPLIHTPTAASVGGDLSKITTRIPPDSQNQVDYADALEREPILLLFATPQFCQSRVCGPVVDVAEQVKHENEGKAAFIHMEIYNENNPDSGTRPQVKAFRLPTEPWLFAIDRDGIVREVVEGAFGVEEMTRIVKEVTAE